MRAAMKMALAELFRNGKRQKEKIQGGQGHFETGRDPVGNSTGYAIRRRRLRANQTAP